MKIVRSISEMQTLTKELKQKNNVIGFVPTMGYLHDGHMQLIDKCNEKSDITILSIFVNPLQFGPNEDFERYPRDEKRDLEIAELHKVDYVFIPSNEAMYPNNLSVKVHVTDRTKVLCGKSRAGHFDGVATVLIKLFHITKCDHVYFGLKDAQQVAVVKGLIDDLNFSIDLIPIETVREANGLARSSRNVYLSEEEKNEAVAIYGSLNYAKKLLFDGENNPVIIKRKVTEFLEAKLQADIEYVEIYNYPALKEIEEVNERIIIAIAVKYTNARLIDNIILDKDGNLPHSFI